MIKSLGPYCGSRKLYAHGQVFVNKLLRNGTKSLVDSVCIGFRYVSYVTFDRSYMSNMKESFRLADYDCIGFDLDNTLLRYNVTNLVHLEFEQLTEFLVNQRGYNGTHLLKPLTDNDLDFMQKGLFLDLERGNILKLGSDGIIHKATHGSRLLSVDAIKKTYPGQRWDVTDAYCQDLLVAWDGPLARKVRGLLDYFDMPVSVVFARTVDTLDEEHGSPLNTYNIWPDILDGLFSLFSREHFQNHKSGFFNYIKKYPEKYMRKCSTETISWLKMLKKKRATFLLTGSNADFANFTASYTFGENWRSLFDIVICFAKKPGFFTGTRRFLDISTNYNETENESRCLMRGEIYSQGNWEDLLKFMSVATGKTDNRCLYIGDNIIQDIYVPKSRINCDTLVIIEEQRAEGMLHHDSTHPDEKILNSKFWNSYFYLKDSINVDSLWGHIIKKYAKLCIPEINVLTQTPLEEPIPSFDKDGKSYLGYYPSVPLSLSAM